MTLDIILTTIVTSILIQIISIATKPICKFCIKKWNLDKDIQNILKNIKNEYFINFKEYKDLWNSSIIDKNKDNIKINTFKNDDLIILSEILDIEIISSIKLNNCIKFILKSKNKQLISKCTQDYYTKFCQNIRISYYQHILKYNLFLTKYNELLLKYTNFYNFSFRHILNKNLQLLQNERKKIEQQDKNIISAFNHST